MCKERGLDPETCDTKELKELMDDAERISCKGYLSCLFILVVDGVRFQGIKRALDKQYLIDKDAYPTNMPQALKLLEKYKAEFGATEQNADSDGEYGVAFSQADAQQFNTTCNSYGERGHGVNECSNLEDAQREKFWTDRKATYTALKSKKGVAHAAVAEEAVDATPAPPSGLASVPSSDRAVDLEHFQSYMDMLEATNNLDVGFIHVGKLSESCHYFFSQGTVTTIETTDVQGKHLLFSAVKNSPVKRFTLYSHKLYLDSCFKYNSAFVRWMLDDVNTVTTVLQGNCNAVLSTSNEMGFCGLWNFWLNEQGIAKLLSIPQL